MYCLQSDFVHKQFYLILLPCSTTLYTFNKAVVTCSDKPYTVWTTEHSY